MGKILKAFWRLVNPLGSFDFVLSIFLDSVECLFVNFDLIVLRDDQVLKTYLSDTKPLQIKSLIQQDNLLKYAQDVSFFNHLIENQVFQREVATIQVLIFRCDVVLLG